MSNVNNNEQAAIISATTEACSRVVESQFKNQLEIIKLQLEYAKEERKDWMQLLSAAVPAAFAFFAEQMQKDREVKMRGYANEEKMQSDRHEHEVRMQEMKLKTAEAASGKSKDPVSDLFSEKIESRLQRKSKDSHEGNGSLS